MATGYEQNAVYVKGWLKTEERQALCNLCGW